MSYKSIRADIVREVLTHIGETFRTKELSNDSAMRQAHPELSNQKQYHAWVGSFLSRECADVSQIKDARDTDAGALWRNLLFRAPAISSASGAGAAMSDVEPAIDLGPQCRSDASFTARMRLHQSRYRAHELCVPCGTGPTAASDLRLGNMLRAEDARNGLNFLTAEIYAVARARLAEGRGYIEPFRLLHNMLSSQPLCFNLFAPMVRDLELATALMQTVRGLAVARVLAVDLEVTPGDGNTYLGDGTAFDAYVEYMQPDGRRAFVGIEVKLTEPFSQKVYDSVHYRRWMEGARSPWRADATDRVANVEHNQLWRDHLLAVAHRERSRANFARGQLMLVRHAGDLGCERVVRNYMSLLRDEDDSFIDMSLDRLLAYWETATLTTEQHAWLTALRRRYLDLDVNASTHTGLSCR